VTHDTTTRRGLLAGFAAAPVAALPPPTPAPDADAELIRLCDQHIANVRAYNRDGGTGDGIGGDDDPLWQACEQTEAAIDVLPPQTIAGVVAKAKVARAEAREGSPEGGQLWDGGAAVPWARDVVNDLLRLFAEG
jgi:hypothetical protein